MPFYYESIFGPRIRTSDSALSRYECIEMWWQLPKKSQSIDLSTFSSFEKTMSHSFSWRGFAGYYVDIHKKHVQM